MTEKNEAAAGLRADNEPEIIENLAIDSLNMKQLIELDACTRCGECLTWCPVYDQDSRESLIPRRKVIDFLKIARAQQGYLGKIMKTKRLSAPLKGMLGRVFGYRTIGKAEIDDFVQNLYECSTCGQCEVVCPARIDTVNIWEELRRVIVQAGYGPLETQQALVKSVKAFDNPWQQPRAARTKWARRAKKDGLINNLPRDIRKTKGKVLLFFGCTASYDVNVKQVAINTINILEALDIDYGVLGSEEKCCGSVLLRMGDEEHKRLFKENIDLFNSLGIDTLISSCSGCFKTILQDYPKIAPLNFEVLHTVEYLTRLLKNGQLTFPHPVNRKVTYHDPCHLGRATGGFEAPRAIMAAIPGLELVEMPRNSEYSRCCGAGGGLKAGFPEVQNKMAQRRIKEAEETGAQELVSCCPFCYQGLNIGISGLESQLVMKDMSALVAESLLGYDVFEQAAQKAAAKTRKPAADRGSRRARRRAAKPTPAATPAAPADAAPDLTDARAAKKLEREQRRAARKAESGKKTATPSTAVDTDPAAGQAPAPLDARAAKKLEREQRRAARKAERGNGKARRKAETEDAATVAAPSAAEPAVTEETSPPAAPQPPAAETASTADRSEKATTAATKSKSDPKADREARRAAKRAAREKQKAARRAAREKG
jgi:heterodisulfide reductase subunit D